MDAATNRDREKTFRRMSVLLLMNRMIVGGVWQSMQPLKS